MSRSESERLRALTMTERIEPSQPDLLLLDGLCGLCNRCALFVKSRLANSDSLNFVTIESEEGQRLTSGFPEPMREMNTVYLMRGGKVFVRSAAVVRLIPYLRWWWRPMFPVLWLIPLPVRDFAYRFVAKRRRRWFKPVETCAF
jgi:predicted DCC family thiol-disulfide oxidoreductase YuxK